MTRSNNWGLFSLEGQPIDVSQLAGKKVGIYNDSWTAAMLPLMLESGGLTMDDVQTVAATASVIPLLLRGRIDVATEVTNLGGVEITTSGGPEPQVLLAPEVGAPDTPVWVYVAGSDFAAENPEVVTAWLDATRRGAEWAAENPEEAVALFEDAYPDTASGHEYNLEAWNATVPLLTKDGEFFTQTDEQWTEFTQALVDAGQLETALTPGDYYTNDYLP
jgi:ABC-type nitrate/sulfonate/bicarbonate transport system substrate-binding protein